MSRSEAELERVRLALLEVVIEPALWPDALKAVADVCGAASAQLVARDGQNRPLVNWVSGVDPATMRLAEQLGQGDPKANPRLLLGRVASPMTIVEDLIDPDMRRKFPIYADFYDRHEANFNCQTVLDRNADLLLRTSLSKSSSQGPFTSGELKAFSALLPYLQAAARHQALAERRAIEGLLAESEATGRPAFVLNRYGKLVGASSEGEAEFRRRRFLVARQRRIRAVATAADELLQQAIGRAVAIWHDGLYAPPRTIALNGRTDGQAIQAQVIALTPKPYGLADEPAALVLLKPPSSGISADILSQRYRFTRAEAEIALNLAMGMSLADIAAARGVSVATVRVQLKSVFAKADVRRQSELVALLKN